MRGTRCSTAASHVSCPPRVNADATLTADPKAWTAIADDVRGGMTPTTPGRLLMRRNLHLGVGFLAATSGLTDPGRLRFRTVATRRARLSTLEAGSGPTVAGSARAGRHQGIVPAHRGRAGGPLSRHRRRPPRVRRLRQADRRGLRRALLRRAPSIDLLDALELERVHLIGNSLGGRVALEVGLLHPDRVDRLALLCPLAGVATRATVGAAASPRAARARPGSARPAAGRRGDRAPPHPGRR